MEGPQASLYVSKFHNISYVDMQCNFNSLANKQGNTFLEVGVKIA